MFVHKCQINSYAYCDVINQHTRKAVSAAFPLSVGFKIFAVCDTRRLICIFHFLVEMQNTHIIFRNIAGVQQRPLFFSPFATLQVFISLLNSVS